MTVAQSWPLQEAVFSAVKNSVALETIVPPVKDYTPTNPPEEYIRIDGFSIADRSFKNQEQGQHSFMVHVFTKAAGTGTSKTRGQQRVKLLLKTIHEFMVQFEFDYKTVDFQYMDIEDDEDGTSQHGWLRYAITI